MVPFRPEVQSVRVGVKVPKEVAESSQFDANALQLQGSFRLSLNMSAFGGGTAVSEDIAAGAVAMALQETAGAGPGRGAGESFESRLRAMASLTGSLAGHWAPGPAKASLGETTAWPGISVTVSRRDLNPLTDGWIGWRYDVTFSRAPAAMPRLEAIGATSGGVLGSLQLRDAASAAAVLATASPALEVKLSRPAAAARGTFMLRLHGRRTAPIPWDASPALLAQRLEALPGVESVRVERQSPRAAARAAAQCRLQTRLPAPIGA